MARLVQNVRDWQQRVGEQRLPSQSSTASDEERNLAYRWANTLCRIELTAEQQGQLLAVPGCPEDLFEEALDVLVAKLVRETLDWQQKMGEQRMPTYGDKASNEERALHLRWLRMWTRGDRTCPHRATSRWKKIILRAGLQKIGVETVRIGRKNCFLLPKLQSL